MKKRLLFLALLLAAADICAQSPDYSRKFGKVTDYEMQMSSYARDTSAVAVYLYEDTQVCYIITPSNQGNMIKQKRDYYVKIKVLKPEGVSLADVSIPFHTLSSTGRKEVVSGISAAAYNNVDGKMVKTAVGPKEIITEQVSENIQLQKFSIREVRVGTVMEYKYTILSDYYWTVDPIEIQHEYPVVYSFAEVATPQYFRFNINTQGYHQVIVKQSQRNMDGYYDDVRTCVALDIPALKDESHVWDMDDFRTKITLEFKALEINGYVESYTSTWQSVNENLDKSDFAQDLKMTNLLKDEVATIKAEGGDPAEQVRKILKLVTSRMNWDGRYAILGKNIRQKLGDGAGSSADINFVLNSALRDAGFKTTPILLSPRQYGRLPYTHPSLDNIRTFILMVYLPDGSRVFVDGTSRNNDLNLIPTQLMVDRARILGILDDEGWIDLTNLSDNSQRIMVRCQIDENGLITGSMDNKVGNAMGVSMKSRYRAAGSEEEYIEKLESENDMDISSYEVSGLDDASVLEHMDFSMKTENGGQHTFVMSTVVPFITKSSFTQQERILPVEFPYPARIELTAVLVVPDGYEVEEMPEPLRMSACEDGLNYMYLTSVAGNTITIRAKYSLNRSVFTAKEYPDLYTFMGTMIEKNNSRIVLKKKM